MRLLVQVHGLVTGCSVDPDLYFPPCSRSCLIPPPSPLSLPVNLSFPPAPLLLTVSPAHLHILAYLANHYSRLHSKTASPWKLFLTSLAGIMLLSTFCSCDPSLFFFSVSLLKLFEWLIYLFF